MIYAGLKNGIWSIYRNTDSIVDNTGYSHDDISSDYAFFDVTNPKHYIFIKKESDGTYSLYKNNKTLPGKWEDIGLDAQFGYDSTIIMTVRDETGWRVLEL